MNTQTRQVGTTGHVIDQRGVDHPAHYNNHPSGIEAIEIKRHLPSSLGDAFKYVFRRGEKGDVVKDIDKAQWYLEDQINNHVSPGRISIWLRGWSYEKKVLDGLFYELCKAEKTYNARRFYEEVHQYFVKGEVGHLSLALKYAQALKGPTKKPVQNDRRV